MEEKLIQLAMENGADLVGLAPAERFSTGDPIFRIFPDTKTVIGLAFRILRGTYRGTEEGSTYYQYTTMAVENMEETIMPMAQLRLAMALEAEGYIALPQRRHQQIMQETDSTNPEVAYDAVYRGKSAEAQMDFLETAIACGLGEKGQNGTLLTDAFGPMVRWCFVLTDAELSPTPVKAPHLCDGCGKCRKGCPGGAIDENGNIDPWQCSVYYNGANGLKNPFMPPDALSGMEDRLQIIAGEAKVTPETARKILDKLYFYPPAQHAYQCAICGMACHVECYVHLEEKGVLTKKFQTPFRKRVPWQFELKDYQNELCNSTAEKR